MTLQHRRLDGKAAIVTGAAAGIGRAIAERFAAEGARVVLADQNAAEAQAVAAAIVAAGGAALAVAVDVSAHDQVQRLFDATIAAFGAVDVLVNNAALVKTERHVLEADIAWWSRIIDVNLSGAFSCSLLAAQLMARRRTGSIINLSSGGATKAHRGNVAYDAAKGGIEAMTRAMALDLGPYGVRVNALVPGSIDSKGMAPEVKASRGENIPLGRVGESAEMAGPAVFLASDDASYITGHTLVVDGGMLVQQRSATVDIFPLSKFPKLG
ncbi:SDR family NAD(P)-dependent oxidoreductase [Kouleothrix sp.]|uniref:SDR family NAD(P)-dependent oxidoreductase n=1 Tax=Kouleothrix sp. TaxID=2779161 RepID=UPI00391B8118